MIILTKAIMSEYKNKNILVTGGTGAIGLALVKQLLSCKPKLIKILSQKFENVPEPTNKKIKIHSKIYVETKRKG